MATVSDRTRRRNTKKVTTGMKAVRNMLDAYIHGDGQYSIHIINSIRPKDVMEYIVGHPVTIEGASNWFLSAVSIHNDVPAEYQDGFKCGRVWQGLAHAMRRIMQEPEETRRRTLADFREFVETVEAHAKWDW